MSAINAYKRSAYGVLKDLVDVSDGNDSIFYKYKDKVKVGKEIFKELYARFQKEGDKGFYMDDSKEIGILSQCQSLQALLLLASDFKLKFDDAHILSEEDTNYTIRQIMDFVIDDVIKRIYNKKTDTYIFDASPYDTGRHFTAEYSNIEAITWVVPSFLQVLKYHAVHGETCQWEDQLVNVITYCLNYLNDAFIDSPNVGSSKKLEIGWNFTKKCEEPSLYYTFAVCEAFVEFYETFKEYLDYHEALRNETKHGLAVDKKLREEYKKYMEKYEKILSKEKEKEKDRQGKDPNPNEVDRKARFDEYNELRLRFKEINNGVETLDASSPYGQLEANCKRVAKEVWRLTRGHLADKFYYNDLETTLTEEDIAIATTSDALFNTVYIINIMLDAGLDEDILLEKVIAPDDESAHSAEREYNDLFESCQVASQMTFRTYEKLKTQGKEYIVEQFLVGFNEAFTVHREKVKELRKLRMRVFTLMPLLIRTNNVISEYLVKYPQANMRKYLGYILENRYEEKNKFKWIWENDGFFSCSNYYYISALGEFYKYYETYESKFIKNYNDNETSRAKIKSDYLTELTNPGGEISDLKNNLEEKKEEIEKLKEELKRVATPVEDAVVEVVTREMDKLLPDKLCRFITEAARALTVDDVDNTPCAEKHKAFSNAMNELLFATISKHIFDCVRSGRVSEKENIDKHNELSGKLKKEIRRCIKQFISQINDSDEGRSSLFD